jgi:hypothetical protein
MSKARVAWLFGLLLVLAGLLPVLLFALGSLLPSAEASALLGVFPDFSWLGDIERWLMARRIPWAPSAGLLFALPGLALMCVGAAVATSQEAALYALRLRAQDARRRVRQYGPMERIEPTLN